MTSKLIEGFYVIPNEGYPDRDSLWDGTVHASWVDATASLARANAEWGQDAENYHVVGLIPTVVCSMIEQLEHLGVAPQRAAERVAHAAMLESSAVPFSLVQWICRVSARGAVLNEDLLQLSNLLEVTR